MTNEIQKKILKEAKDFEVSVGLTVSLFSIKINSRLTEGIIEKSKTITKSLKEAIIQNSEDEYMTFIFQALKACYDIEVGMDTSDKKEPIEERFTDIVRHELKNLKKLLCSEMEQPSFMAA